MFGKILIRNWIFVEKGHTYLLTKVLWRRVDLEALEFSLFSHPSPKNEWVQFLLIHSFHPVD